METWKQEFLQLPGRQDEIEWLKNRLETMSVREEIILSGSIWADQPRAAADVIRHIIYLPHLDICAGANSYAALGEFFLKRESPLKLPPDALDFVDTETLGSGTRNCTPASSSAATM